MSTHILLIRHATNPWVGKRLAGWTPGVHLDEAGVAEAKALAHHLAGVRLDALYSSPLERARETAAAVADGRGLDVRELSAIGEVHYGSWTGGDLKALGTDPLWRVVQHAPSLMRFPAGESLAETQARAVSGIEAVRLAHPGQTVAVVSHADVIKVVVAYHIGLPLDLFQRLAVDTASVSILAFGEEGARLVAFNPRGPLRLPAAEDAAKAPEAGV